MMIIYEDMDRLYRCFIWVVAILFITACHRMVIVVDEVPANTPAGEPFYFASNINRWNPGDSRYQLVVNSDSVYQIVLPPGFGKVEYKFTRGDWRSVETDLCGRDIENRVFILSRDDTIHHIIESWHDLFPLNCEGLTIILERIPENTPADADIYFVSNVRDWRLYDKNYLLKRNSLGLYEVKIPKRPGEHIECKFNRGPWSTVEVDAWGDDIDNRLIAVGKADTLYFRIEGWKDLH